MGKGPEAETMWYGENRKGVSMNLLLRSVKSAWYVFFN